MAIGTATAILGGAAISALASGSASNKAVKASSDATDKTVALQQQQYDQTRADLSPYAQAGQTGLTALQERAANENGGVYGNTQNPTYTPPAAYQDPGAFKYTAADYTESPGYKFQLERGLDAIQSSQASRGAMYSGATQKALAKFSQGLAAQDFSQERAAAENTFNTTNSRQRSAYDVDTNRERSAYEADRGYLTDAYRTQTGLQTNLASIGQAAASGQAAAGQNYAANAGNAYAANASNVGNAALTNSANLTGLIGGGLNAYAYGQGQNNAAPGVVNSLASGGVVPRTAAVPYNNRTYGY
jgi:hypothetical protein